MKSRKWLIVGAVVAIVFAVSLIAGRQILTSYVQRRARIALRDAYGGRLQVAALHVQLFPGVHVDAEGLVLPQPDRPDIPPLISIKRVSGNTGFLSALRHPIHVASLRVEGLEIHVPPRQEGESRFPKSHAKAGGFVIDELTADHASLEILPRDARKQPLEFEINELTMNDAGPASPMTFRAVIENALPPGNIHSTGKFGPLDLNDPANSAVEGSYTFQKADLSAFKGIAGLLSSTGNYTGTLDHIAVQGQTDTPDFTVLLSGNPVRLTTQFQAVVDGMDGDTWLNQVNAQLGRTTLAVNGAVTGTKGVPGKTINLNVAVSQGRLEDLLVLGMNGKPAMTGIVGLRSNILIPPGPVDIPNKLRLAGQFHVAEARFKELNVQNRIDKLSDRGRGDPRDDGGSVASDFQGKFTLNDGVMQFSSLSFEVPGVQVALHGSYGLLNEELDFHGTASLQAKLSQTVTGFKSLLLKAVDPVFAKHGKGTVLPIKIGGTSAAPAFGLDGRKALKEAFGGSVDPGTGSAR